MLSISCEVNRYISERIIMKERFKQLRSFNWRLFASLCALALIPAIYQTVRTFIIASNSQSDVFNIIGQMEWFDLINETLQAFLIVPLYSILNKIFKNDNTSFAKYTFKTALLTIIIYSLFSISVLIYGGVLIKAMNPGEIDIATANTYLRLETGAFMIGIIVKFMNVVFVVVGKDRNVYVFLAIQTVLSLVTDFALIPNFGVYGIAISNIIVNTVLAGSSIILLYVQKYIKFCRFYKNDLVLLKEWGKIGMFSGVQQFVDNLIYAIMICKMVNMVAEQGNYWIVNNFIWGWLLIPISALSEIVKRDCKDGYWHLKLFNYYFIIVCVIIVWAITIPLWTPFFKYAENLTNANEIFLIAMKLVPFYIAYAGSAVIDNIFIGLGKTIYNAINSLVINVVYYGIFFILYLTNAVTFTLDVIVLMFGFGMVVHLAVSIIEEKCFLRRFAMKQKLLLNNIDK